jgi:hypothetical protein
MPNLLLFIKCQIAAKAGSSSASETASKAMQQVSEEGLRDPIKRGCLVI